MWDLCSRNNFSTSWFKCAWQDRWMATMGGTALSRYNSTIESTKENNFATTSETIFRLFSLRRESEYRLFSTLIAFVGKIVTKDDANLYSLALVVETPNNFETRQHFPKSFIQNCVSVLVSGPRCRPIKNHKARLPTDDGQGSRPQKKSSKNQRS